MLVVGQVGDECVGGESVQSRVPETASNDTVLRGLFDKEPG